MQGNLKLAVLIKEVRESKGLSQYALSKALGKKTMGHYSQIEKGIVTPKIDAVLKIAEVLGCKVEQLYKLID